MTGLEIIQAMEELGLGHPRDGRPEWLIALHNIFDMGYQEPWMIEVFEAEKVGNPPDFHKEET